MSTEVVYLTQVQSLTIDSTTTEVLVANGLSTELLIEEVQTIQLVEVAKQGPPGPQGAPGQSGASYLTYAADGAVSGHRVMRPSTAGKVAYADNATLADANSVLGISMNAAVDGDEVHVQSAGELTEPSWNWTPGLPVFLGTNGGLTQTPPATGFLLVVATVVTPTTVLVGIKLPIIL